MLRSAMMVGVIALCCVGVAQSAEAQSHGRMGFNHGSFGGRGFARFQSPRFERRPEFLQHRRFFVHRRFFDRDRFFFGFGGFPYYPYYTSYGAGYYPYASAALPEGPSANSALPLPSTQVGDLPPCRENGPEGVVIVRGTACARSKP